MHLLEGPFEWIVGADSGTEHALTLGVSPTVVIGDMDSIDGETLRTFEHIRIQPGPDAQDKLDSEIAIEWALRQGATQIVLAGGLGGRFDQSLANSGLLSKIHEFGASGVVTDGREAVYLLDEKSSPVHLIGTPGTRLSVVPMERCFGLRIEGVEWPLENYDLFPGDTRTLSNEMTKAPAIISVRSGTAFVIVGSKGQSAFT